MELFIQIAVSLVMGILTAYFASKRGRNATIWFIIGMLLGIFGLLILFIMPRAEGQAVQTKREVSSEVSVIAPQQKHTVTIPIDEPSEWYYLDSQHTQFGPIKLSALSELFAKGQLQPSSFVWKKGMGDWMKIEELPYLIDNMKPLE